MIPDSPCPFKDLEWQSSSASSMEYSTPSSLSNFGIPMDLQDRVAQAARNTGIIRSSPSINPEKLMADKESPQELMVPCSPPSDSSDSDSEPDYSQPLELSWHPDWMQQREQDIIAACRAPTEYVPVREARLNRPVQLKVLIPITDGERDCGPYTQANFFIASPAKRSSGPQLYSFSYD